MSEEGNKLFELNNSHKDSIVIKCFETKYVSIQEKQALLELVVGDDKSDIAINLKLTCHALTPDLNIKEEVWREITNPNSSSKSKPELEAMMNGFYCYE